VSLLSALARVLAPDEAEAVRRDYERQKPSDARRRLDLDKRAWLRWRGLGEELSEYELALAELYTERWLPAPPPVDQLTGRLAEPARRPAPWFKLGRVNPHVHPDSGEWIKPGQHRVTGGS
jgi:hypothetical protein